MNCGNILNMKLLLAVLPLLVASATAWWIPQSSSCSGRCGDSFDGSFTCQCNSACTRIGDCCNDFSDICDNTCSWRCGEEYYPGRVCYCNTDCTTYGNCCSDYQNECNGGSAPTGPAPTNPPATDSPPANSCASRCNDPYDSSQPCQCNTECASYGNCCSDYSQLCGGGGGVTPEDLSALAQDLWDSDESRADPADYTLNKQAQVADGNTADQSPQPLFTYVNEDIFNRPTFATFIALMDNYNPNYGIDEVITPEEKIEHEDFMNAIMATKVFTKTANFLISKDYFADEAEVRAKIEEAWFTLYSRSSPNIPPKDSSGFEHVFLGEYKSGSKVNGFHNWVQFYFLEKAGDINYYGYVREDMAHDLLGANFVWKTYNKALGSFMYGASLEFELAMMTTCFTVFPGKVCTFELNGSELKIQTYTIHTKHVGSSYFIA